MITNKGVMFLSNQEAVGNIYDDCAVVTMAIAEWQESSAGAFDISSGKGAIDLF